MNWYEAGEEYSYPGAASGSTPQFPSLANKIDINWYEAGVELLTLELLLGALHRLHHLLTKLTLIGTKQGRNLPTLELLLEVLHRLHHLLTKLTYKLVRSWEGSSYPGALHRLPNLLLKVDLNGYEAGGSSYPGAASGNAPPSPS